MHNWQVGISLEIYRIQMERENLKSIFGEHEYRHVAVGYTQDMFSRVMYSLGQWMVDAGVRLREKYDVQIEHGQRVLS